MPQETQFAGTETEIKMELVRFQSLRPITEPHTLDPLTFTPPHTHTPAFASYLLWGTRKTPSAPQS